MLSPKEVTEGDMEVDSQDPLGGVDVQIKNSPGDKETETNDLLNEIDTDESLCDVDANNLLNKLKTEELILDFDEEDPIADNIQLEEPIYEPERDPVVEDEQRKAMDKPERESVIDIEVEESITSIAAPIIVLDPEDLDEFSQPPSSPMIQKTQDGVDLDAEHIIDRREKKKIKYYYKAKAEEFSRKADVIQENIATVKNVLNACKYLHSSSYVELLASSTPQSKLRFLEHLTRDNLEYLLNTVAEDSNYEQKTVKNLIHTMQPIPADAQQFIYDDIRKVFVEFYVNNKVIPTKSDFIKTLLAMRNPDYIGIFIETLINNNLIKYHHLPKLNRYIITENPALVYKRHIFLRQISESRSREAEIMYVSIKVPKVLFMTPKYMAIAASAAGLIDKCEKIKYRNGHDDKFENPEIRSWIQHDVIPKIEPGWIIHLTTIRKKDTTPTAFSSKIEMLDWLMKHEVPCDANFHSAQLYSLIKLHKGKSKCFYEDLFTCSGFRVINCPIEYESLDYFRDITTKTAKLEDAVRIEQRLVLEEQQMMKEDAEMDRIVENLFEMVKNDDVKANDFPNGCKGTKGDNVYAHIGDIII